MEKLLQGVTLLHQNFEMNIMPIFFCYISQVQVNKNLTPLLQHFLCTIRMNQGYTSDTWLFPLFSKIFGTPPPPSDSICGRSNLLPPPPPPLIRGGGGGSNNIHSKQQSTGCLMLYDVTQSLVVLIERFTFFSKQQF